MVSYRNSGFLELVSYWLTMMMIRGCVVLFSLLAFAEMNQAAAAFVDISQVNLDTVNQTPNATAIPSLRQQSLEKARMGDAPLWRWPYSPSPYVITNPNDGLPDFSGVAPGHSFNYTNETIACPQEVQRECCDHVHGDGNCPSTCHTRPCSGGMYCANLWRDGGGINSTYWFPNHIGAALERTPVNRTRRNILQRAVGWLALHTPYLGCHTPAYRYTGMETCAEDDPPECPQYGHTASCEGYVTMAHGAPKYDDMGDRTIIPCTELQPGDGCFHHNEFPGGVNHVWMFREWAETEEQAEDRGARRMRLYQMGGGGGATNMAVQRKGTPDCGVTGKGPCIVCFKYSHIVDE